MNNFEQNLNKSGNVNNEDELRPLSPEEIKVKWEKEYEETHQDLKDALVGNEKIYEEQKAEWISLQQEAADAYTDSVTGLERRERLFLNMREQIAKIFKIENIGEVSSQKLIEEFTKEDVGGTESNNLYTTMGDISFLGWANKDGHATGDRLLASVGEKTRSLEIKAFQHGGDEITSLIRGDKEAVGKKIEEFRKEITGLDEIDGFKPNIDIGVASLAEGLEAFRKLHSTTESKKALAESPLKELENIWLEIADKRSMISKGRERILLLMNIKSENETLYRETIDFFRKGGYNISDSELDELIEEAGNTEDVTDVINEFIKKREEGKLSNKKGYEKVRLEVINDIAI